MSRLRWQQGESGDAYEDRVNHVYDEFSWKIDAVRVSFSTPPDALGDAKVAAPRPAAKPAKAKSAAAKAE